MRGRFLSNNSSKGQTYSYNKNSVKSPSTRNTRNNPSFRARNTRNIVQAAGECNSRPITWTSGCGVITELGCNPTEAQILAALDESNLSATSTCSPDSTVTIVGDELIYTAKNGCHTTATRTYTATDLCGNKTTCMRSVVYREDVDGPIITIVAEPEDGNLGCNPTEEEIDIALGDATYYDECDCLELEATFEDGPVETDACGKSKTRTWTATDECGVTSTASRTVYWSSDTTPPVITAVGTPADGELGCNPTDAEIEAALGSADAEDNCGQVDIFVEDTPVQLNGCEKSITRTWTAVDGCGNEATPVQRTVYWRDDVTPPVISCPPNLENVPVSRIIPCGQPVIFQEPEIQDDCGGEIQLTYVDEVTEIICRTWIATDSCGNTSTCQECVAVEPCPSKGCTIGFWKQHPEVWPSVNPGFTVNDDFFAFFGLDPGTADLSPPLTMLGALSLGGGGCRNLARQGVAALLSSAAFGADYNYPDNITDFASLKSAIASALVTETCGDLASKLDAANNGEDENACNDLKNQVVSATRRFPASKGRKQGFNTRNPRTRYLPRY